MALANMFDKPSRCKGVNGAPADLLDLKRERKRSGAKEAPSVTTKADFASDELSPSQRVKDQLVSVSSNNYFLIKKPERRG